MKAIRFVIPKTGKSSFRIQRDQSAYFYDSIHYHPEHQLTCLLKGEGTCFIGNYVGRFEPGHVYLIGRNVPHVFKCDRSYYQPDAGLESESISLYLKNETLGPQFFDIPEMVHVKRLMEKGLQGIRFYGSECRRITEMVQAIRQQEGFQRILTILSLLDRMADAEAIQLLSSIQYNRPSSESEHERINIIFDYLSRNFRNEISLATISSVAHMTPSSFCRYFKQRTGKVYSLFVNEMRVEYAGRRIATGAENLGLIAAESGFNSISYFNRQFKRITRLTPMDYRKKYGL